MDVEFKSLVNEIADRFIYINFYYADALSISENFDEIQAHTGITGFPSYTVDRKGAFIPPQRTSADDNTPFQYMLSQCPDIGEIPIGITIAHSFNNSTKKISGNVIVQFDEIPEENDLRVFLFIAQDKIIEPQSNYYNVNPSYPELYNKGIKIADYEHSKVFRDEALAGSIWGVPLTIGTDKQYTVPINYTLESTYGQKSAVPEDIYLIAGICSNNGEIFNADMNHLIFDATEKSNFLPKSKINFTTHIKNQKLIIKCPTIQKFRVKGFSLNGKKLINTDWYTSNEVSIPVNRSIRKTFLILEIETEKGIKYIEKTILRF